MEYLAKFYNNTLVNLSTDLSRQSLSCFVRVGGLLQCFKDGGVLSYDVDFDTITTPGIYSFYAQTLIGNNAPDTTNAYSSILIVGKSTDITYSHIFIEVSTCIIHTRRKTTASWEPWIKKS